jgi:two-component system OmpR family sensor kinase
MKWIHSIITKITLIFILAIIGIGAISFIFLTHEKEKELEHMEQFARYAIHSSFDNTTKEIDFKNLENFGLIVLEDAVLKKEILTKFSLKKLPENNQKSMRNMMRLGTKAIAYNRKIYILIKVKNKDNIVLITPFEKDIFPTLLFLFISISFVILLYIAIIRNFLPIYDLKKKVIMFADGNYDFECTNKNKDEVGALANEFNNAVKKIKKLRDSRQLFLRNIMHELKTPITKGKFVSELIEDTSYKSSLENIFKRQEDLLEEFSRIEKLSADELPLHIRSYQFEDILDFSLDILNHDDTQVIKDISPMKIEADFELFGTAIKNLLDNGIKYSIDSKVSITNSANEIFITNRANALEFPLEMYAQAYFLEGKKQKSSRGLGFGLFIVLSIIKLHNMKITYKRENDKNIFIITLNANNS